MPFTSPTLLETSIGTTLVTSFVAAHPELLDSLIAHADSIMTTASGIQPPDDPSVQTGNEQMLVYAGWIVKYLMLDHIGIRDRDEVDRRKSDYDRAIRALTDMRGRPTTPAFTRPQAVTQSTQRVGECL